MDDPDDSTPNSPQNSKHNLEASDGSENNSEPDPEINLVDNNNDKMGEGDDETNLEEPEEPEESAETELGRGLHFCI